MTNAQTWLDQSTVEIFFMWQKTASNMKTTKLTPIKSLNIKKVIDSRGKGYYVNSNDNQDAYFCFEGSVKEGRDELVNNYENI